MQWNINRYLLERVYLMIKIIGLGLNNGLFVYKIKFIYFVKQCFYFEYVQ